MAIGEHMGRVMMHLELEWSLKFVDDDDEDHDEGDEDCDDDEGDDDKDVDQLCRIRFAGERTAVVENLPGFYS